MFNAIFNNISVILWRSVLLVEETGAPGQDRRPTTSRWQTLSHNCCIKYTSLQEGLELTTLVAIGTDCTGSCKSNYHMITMRTPLPPLIVWLSPWRRVFKAISVHQGEVYSIQHYVINFISDLWQVSGFLIQHYNNNPRKQKTVFIEVPEPSHRREQSYITC